MTFRVVRVLCGISRSRTAVVSLGLNRALHWIFYTSPPSWLEFRPLAQPIWQSSYLRQQRIYPWWRVNRLRQMKIDCDPFGRGCDQFQLWVRLCPIEKIVGWFVGWRPSAALGSGLNLVQSAFCLGWLFPSFARWRLDFYRAGQLAQRVDLLRHLDALARSSGLKTPRLRLLIAWHRARCLAYQAASHPRARALAIADKIWLAIHRYFAL